MDWLTGGRVDMVVSEIYTLQSSKNIFSPIRILTSVCGLMNEEWLKKETVKESSINMNLSARNHNMNK